MRVRYLWDGEVCVSEILDVSYNSDFGILTFTFICFDDLKFKIPSSYVSNIFYHLLTEGFFDFCGLGSLLEPVD